MATTVADADVAVHADVSPFSRELKKKLEPIVKAAGKDLKTKVDVDSKDFEKNLKESVDTVSKKVKAKVDVEADERGGAISRLSASVSSLVKRAGNKIRLAIPLSIEAGVKNLAQDISRLSRAALGKARLAIPVSIEAGAKNIVQDIARLTRSATGKARLAIPVTLEASLKDALRVVGDLSRRIVSRVRLRLPISFGTAKNVTEDVFSSLTSAAAQAASSIGKSLGSIFSSLPGLASGVQSAFIPALVLIGVYFIPLLITATGVLAGLTGGLISMAVVAGGAFAAFGLAAFPVISDIIKAVQGGNAEIKKLPKNLRGAAKEVAGLKTAFMAWLKPLQGPIAGLVGQLAKLAQSILPSLTPIVTGITGVFSQFIDKVNNGLQSTTMLTFFNNLQTVGVRIFANLTDAIGHFGLGFISMVNTFAPFAERLSQGLDRVAKKFQAWAESPKGTNDIFSFIQWVKDNGKDFLDKLKELADKAPGFLKKLASKDVKGDLNDLATVLHATADAIDLLAAALRGLKRAYDDVKGFVDLAKNFYDGDNKQADDSKKISGGDQSKIGTVKGKGSPNDPGAPAPPAAGFSFGPLTQQAGIAASIMKTVFSSAFNVAKTVAGSSINWIALRLTQLPGQATTALSTLGTVLFTSFSTAFGIAQTAVTFSVSAITSTIGSIVGRAWVAASPLVGALMSVGTNAVNAMSSGIRSGVSAVASAASSVLNAAQSALNIGGRFFSSGLSLASQFASGIRAGIGVVANAVESLAKKAWNLIPHSPVKEGPLRVLNNGYAGKQVSKMLADGITAGAPLIDKAMSAVLRIPAGQVSQKMSSSNTNITKSPVFNVSSPSANPMDVALAMFRQARLSGAF